MSVSDRFFSAGVDTPVAFPGWDAIWAGTFAFVAIWSVLGALGLAIFAAGPNLVGMGIWTVILSIIALFVAGRVTSRLALGHDVLMLGTVTFGLCVAASLVIGLFAALGLSMVSAAAGAHLMTAGTLAGVAWVGFLSMLLGWIACVIGASSMRHHRAMETPAEHARRVAA